MSLMRKQAQKASQVYFKGLLTPGSESLSLALGHMPLYFNVIGMGVTPSLIPQRTSLCKTELSFFMILA